MPKKLHAGSIKKIGKNKYQVRVFIGRDAAGKQHYKTRTVTGTKADAEAVGKKIVYEVDAGKVTIKSNNITVEEFFEWWINDLRRLKRALSTIERHESSVRLYIAPILGKKKLCDLSRADVMKCIDYAKEKGLAVESLKKIQQAIHAGLNAAIEEELILSNPCRKITFPKTRLNDVRVLNDSEVQILKQYLKKDAHRTIEHIVILMLATGLRRAEVSGLCWADYSAKRRTLSVSRTLSDAKGAGINYFEPKTMNSKRTISIGNELCALLDLIKAEQATTFDKYGLVQDSGTPIFANTIAEPIRPHSITNMYRRFLKRHGIEHMGGLHTLRHTHCSKLMALGMNPKLVSLRMGHASVSFTLERYSHFAPQGDRELAVVAEQELFCA